MSVPRGANGLIRDQKMKSEHRHSGASLIQSINYLEPRPIGGMRSCKLSSLS